MKELISAKEKARILKQCKKDAKEVSNADLIKLGKASAKKYPIFKESTNFLSGYKTFDRDELVDAVAHVCVMSDVYDAMIENSPELRDAQQMAKDHPDTFQAPSKDELDSLKIGSIVKVCAGGERFWTIIDSISGDDIVATVDNVLVFQKDFNVGDAIQFQKKHIFDINELSV